MDWKLHVLIKKTFINKCILDNKLIGLVFGNTWCNVEKWTNKFYHWKLILFVFKGVYVLLPFSEIRLKELFIIGTCYKTVIISRRLVQYSLATRLLSEKGDRLFAYIVKKRDMSKSLQNDNYFVFRKSLVYNKLNQ